MSEVPIEKKSTGPETTAEQGQASGEVLFRSKKRRSRKARVKIQVKEHDEEAAEDDQPEMTLSEMTILKEAQELRELTRITSFRSSTRDAETKKRDGEEEGEEVDDPTGLKESFAVEKSSHIAEERMSRYVEERMAEQFKDSRKNSDGKESKPADEIYAIPDRLRVDEKPLYDPGEGLPAAGIEEVALADEVRLRNEAETNKARQEVLQKRGATSSNSSKLIPGNVSANFLQYRRAWMHDNVTQHEEGGSKPRQESLEGKRVEAGGDDTSKRRRYHVASDAAVADRFRKRWKR